MKDALGERVGEVRVSATADRFTRVPGARRARSQSLACGDCWSLRGQKAPLTKPVLELNVQHPLVKYLDGLSDAERFKELALLLFDQSALADGAQLEDPADYVRRLNRLLLSLGVGANPGAGS